MSQSETHPYRLDKGEPSCKHCGDGVLWSVVGPDDMSLSRMFTDLDDAEWLTERLNDAYRLGHSTAAREKTLDAIASAREVSGWYDPSTHGDGHAIGAETVAVVLEHRNGIRTSGVLPSGAGLGEIAYEAYRAHYGGKSLVTGQPIPAWDELPPSSRTAWQAAGEALLTKVVEGRL